jgi:hypothetical protein
MPLCIRWFGLVALHGKKDAGLDHAGRSRIPGSLFAIEVGALWYLLPW